MGFAGAAVDLLLSGCLRLRFGHGKALKQVGAVFGIVGNRGSQVGQGDVGGAAVGVEQYVVRSGAVAAGFLKLHRIDGEHGGG